MEIKLGDKVIDKITNFEGIVVGEVDYLYGCKQFQVEGVDHNEQPKSWWFDEQRVERIEEDVIVPKVDRVGGPQDVPGSREHPSSMTSDTE